MKNDEKELIDSIEDDELILNLSFVFGLIGFAFSIVNLYFNQIRQSIIAGIVVSLSLINAYLIYIKSSYYTKELVHNEIVRKLVSINYLIKLFFYLSISFLIVSVI